MAQWFLKDPAEKLDYVENWATWLGADTISSSVWAVETGITNHSTSNTTTTATIWLTGGTAGNRYLATNTITTAGNRIGERSVVITVAHR